MNRWRDFDLLFPNDEDLPEEWDMHIAHGDLRAKPTRGDHDDPTLDAVINRVDRPVVPTPTDEADA